MDQSTIDTLKGLFDTGGVVVVTVMLWVVWRRLNDVTDRLIDIATEIRAQTIVMRSSAPNQTQGNVNPQ